MTNAIRRSKKYRPAFLTGWMLPLIVLGLAVRVPMLGEFMTIDEPLWVMRSGHFLGGLLFTDYKCPEVEFGRSTATTGKGCTYQTGHPGVTTMWSGSLGLLLYYWQVVSPTGTELRAFLQTLTKEAIDPTLIALTRLPLAIVSSLFVGGFYVLVKRLFNTRLALLATLLVILSPFHAALSRVLHHDAVTTTFMVLSLLIMLGYWLKGWPWYWLLVSAFCAGFAFLSKPVGWFLMPYAAIVGLLGLYLRRQKAERWDWNALWRLAGEGIVWGVTAWLTFMAFFPAMWIIPVETITGIFGANSDVSAAGHLQFFLGKVSPDPGPLFYPLGWLVRASPLEVIGLLVLPVAAWRAHRVSRTTSVSGYVIKHSVEITLALFLILFLLFETVSSKKFVRYFLPAFPIIGIFVACGLLWLADRLMTFLVKRKMWVKTIKKQWAMPVLGGLIIVTHGWWLLSNYPYYFTYYNPLVGGITGAARLITIFGWGEGFNEAGAYLNQQPDPDTLDVVTWHEGPLNPFFKGQVRRFSTSASQDLQADYLVYYFSQVQLQRVRNTELWTYFYNHHTPAHQVTIHGLDYVLTYRNPIDHWVEWAKNGLPDKLGLFGYTLSPDGTLEVYWQNLGFEAEPDLWAGLSPPDAEQIRWVQCTLPPEFIPEATTVNAILESLCPLTSLTPVPALYDLHLGVGNESAIAAIPFPAGRLALKVNEAGQFVTIGQEDSLALMLEQQLPAEAQPLDIPFGSVVKVVGYQLIPPKWEAGTSNEVTLYWQPLREADFIAPLIDQFQLTLTLTATGANQPLATTTLPLFPVRPTEQDFKRGNIIRADYPLSVPHATPDGDYQVEVCLTTTTQAVPQSNECFTLPVKIF